MIPSANDEAELKEGVWLRGDIEKNVVVEPVAGRFLPQSVALEQGPRHQQPMEFIGLIKQSKHGLGYVKNSHDWCWIVSNIACIPVFGLAGQQNT